MVAFARPALGCAHTVGFTDVFIARDGPPRKRKNLLLYIVLACLMLFAVLSNAACLHTASFLSMISANAFYFHVLYWFIDT